MTNKIIPLDGPRTQAENRTRLPFEGKTPVLPYVEKKAWLMHGPAGAPKTSLAQSLLADRRFVAQHSFNSTVYVTGAGTLKEAVEGDFSVFIDMPTGGSAGEAAMQLLKENGYHIRLISVYASMPVCASDLRACNEFPRDLVAGRIADLHDFAGLAAKADTVSIRYAQSMDEPAVEALYLGSERSAVFREKRRILVGDDAVLRHLIHDLRSEGAKAKMAPLQTFIPVTDADRHALNQAGRAMAQAIEQHAGSKARLGLVPPAV